MTAKRNVKFDLANWESFSAPPEIKLFAVVLTLRAICHVGDWFQKYERDRASEDAMTPRRLSGFSASHPTATTSSDIEDYGTLFETLKKPSEFGVLWCNYGLKEIAAGGAAPLSVLRPGVDEQITQIELDLRIQRARKIFQSLQEPQTKYSPSLRANMENLALLGNWFDEFAEKMAAVLRMRRTPSEGKGRIDPDAIRTGGQD